MKTRLTILVFAEYCSLLTTGCKDRFDPPVLQTNPNFLVIDGFLNNGTDTTTIRLSRTKKIADGTSNAAEQNAQIAIEDEDNMTAYIFQPLNTDGNYFVPGMNLDNNRKYRLRIRTADGKQYLSDAITVKQTPAIDSVSWQKLENGIMIYANTHDPQKSTLYYRWDYTETWEYHSEYFSVIKYENALIITRKMEEWLFTCWLTQNSTDLLLGSSAKLSDDIIYWFPLRQIPVNGVELSVKYSIMVRQYALSKEAFDYLQVLKKITEQMGSIFDVQPSQLAGNIHCLDNPAEPVLGYITACSMAQKRIFIEKGEVLPWNFRLNCEPKKPVPEDSLRYYFEGGVFIPVEQFRDNAGALWTNAGGPFCTDCTTRNGTTIKPAFWQ